MFDLYDYQEADLQEAADHDSWFLCYEMSLGKTLVAIEWARRKGDVETIIVVLPLNTRKSWELTLAKQWPDMPFYRLENTKAHVANFGYLKKGRRGVYVIGWELMRTGALTGQYADMVIADETHKQANYGKSDQSILLREFNSKYKIALSGTPAANKPEGIFATINWLWPKRYSSYWNWTKKFWRVIQNGAIFQLVRELTPGGVVADLPMYTRRLVRDHRDDMPPTLPEIPIEVELTPGQRKIYDRLATEAGAWLSDDDFISTAYTFEQDIRLRQVALGVPTIDSEGKVTFAENAKSSKLDALVEVLDATGDEAFLVLTHSAKFVPVTVARLEKKGIKARGFTAGTSQAERDWLIENLGVEYRVLVSGIAIIAEGTDGLQHNCHNGFWLSKHPEWLKNKQASGRLDRPGQKEPIRWWYTYAKDTVDEKNIQRLEEIEDNLIEMLDRY